MMDAISEIMSATDATDLFGQIEKRAKIRYRRLSREVHPDVNGNSRESNEAMKRLNRLWREYESRFGMAPRRDGTKSPTEVTRNKTFAIFNDGHEWMVVERAVTSGSSRVYDTVEDIERYLDGSPVCLLRCDRAKAISQSDGLHVAYEFVPPDTVSGGHQLIFLSSLAARLTDSIMHPADFAWVTKRVLFLSCVLAGYGMTLDCDDMADCLAIAPDTHMLAVVARVIESDDPWNDRDKLILQYMELAKTMVSNSDVNERIERFMGGVIGDRWASTKELMEEFDDLLIWRFGGLRYHEMKVI